MPQRKALSHDVAARIRGWLRACMKPRLASVPLMLARAIALMISAFRISAGFAQVAPAFIRIARTLEYEKTGLQHPGALSYSSSSGLLRVVDGVASGQAAPASADMIDLTRFGRKA